MKNRIKVWWTRAKHRPTVMINLVGLLVIVLGGGSFLAYQMLRPLDVLKGWEISISDTKQYRVVDGVRMAVFHPGDSLVFTSKSTKIEDAKGTTSRMIVCEPTETQAEREIQLDILSATRPVGVNPVRENAITVPDVAQFEGLPRVCRLVIDITYENVALWRSYSEHAVSEPFIVEEQVLNPKEIQQQIDDLNAKIKDLQNKLSVEQTATSTTTTVQTPKVATVQASPQPTQESEEEPEEEEPTGVKAIPIVGGLLDALGL